MNVSSHFGAFHAQRMRAMLRQQQQDEDEDDLFAVHELMSRRRVMRHSDDSSWQRLPTRTLSEHDVAILGKSEEKKSCAICLTEYGVGDVTRSLPCFHEFHRECIDQWFRSQSEKGKDCSCPLDRKKIKENEAPHDDGL